MEDRKRGKRPACRPAVPGRRGKARSAGSWDGCLIDDRLHAARGGPSRPSRKAVTPGSQCLAPVARTTFLHIHMGYSSPRDVLSASFHRSGTMQTGSGIRRHTHEVNSASPGSLSRSLGTGGRALRHAQRRTVLFRRTAIEPSNRHSRNNRARRDHCRQNVVWWRRERARSFALIA